MLGFHLIEIELFIFNSNELIHLAFLGKIHLISKVILNWQFIIIVVILQNKA